jgi:hippurate hydrolase
MRRDSQAYVSLMREAEEWRHQLHQYPELAYNETRTSEFIATHLEQWGLKVHRGLAATGVVGTLTRGKSERCIGIRADMDALAIQEERDVPYASRYPGVMHACGHDGHVAMALAAAKACSQLSDLDGTVHFIFQPAEENEGGGRRMVEDGLFSLFRCDSIYSLHNWPALPLGTYFTRPGPILSAFGKFEIIMIGHGCHGALPQEGRDPLLATCQLVSALQTIVSRNVDPRLASVLSVTQLLGGETWNIIPDSCRIRGTTRWFEGEVGDVLERRVEEAARGVASAFGCRAEIRYERCYPATVNDATAVTSLHRAAAAVQPSLRAVQILPSTGSEDFSFMLREVPGCYVLLGAGRTDESHSLHTAQYTFNDELLPIGAELWISLVQQSLQPAQLSG